MGWLFMSIAGMGAHPTPKTYLDDQYTWTRSLPDGSITGARVLASSCLRNQVYYAAVEPSTDGVPEPVIAVVCLVRWSPRNRDGEHFGYKSMTEDMGPNESECPARILDLLGPTDSEYALAWRQRCSASSARRSRALPEGAKVRLAEPIAFVDGVRRDEFTVVRDRGRLRFRDATGVLCRIARAKDLDWTVVPQTKVHVPAFPSRGN